MGDLEADDSGFNPLTCQHHWLCHIIPFSVALTFGWVSQITNTHNIEGFQPEWYISTMIYTGSQDIAFWSETLDMFGLFLAIA